MIIGREASTTGAASTSGVTAAGVFSTIASLSVSVGVGFGISTVSLSLAATLVTCAAVNAGFSTRLTSTILAALTNK